MSAMKCVFRLFETKMSEVAEAVEASTPISDFFVSLDLISGSVLSLFIDVNPSELLASALKVETEVEICRRNITRHAKSLDCSEMLRLLEHAEQSHMEDIGAEFFYFPSKKFSKNQSIENYSKFLYYMFKFFGLDVTFLKNFFFNDRDASEVNALLNYMKDWKGLSEEFLNFALAKTVQISLERLVSHAKVEDFLEVFDKNAKLLALSDKIDLQKSLQKLLINLVQSALHRIAEKERFQECLDAFVKHGFLFNEFIFNKILDMMSKNLSDCSMIEFLLGYMVKIGVKPNIVTYNTIMDFHCSRGDFEKAQSIFINLQESEIEPDNFTFSILIKGIKNMKEPSLEICICFYEMYKTSTIAKDIIMFNSLLDVFISMGDIGKAHEIYNDLLKQPEYTPDQITFNTLIKGCCKVKDFPNALRYYNEMRRNNLIPNRITFNSLMDLAVKIQDLNNCLFFVDEMQKDDISPDGYTYSIILNGLKQNSSPVELVKDCLANIQKVIEAKEFRLDEIFFNSILDVCSKYELYDQMNTFYELMKKSEVAESSVTFGIIIKAFGKNGEFEKAYQIFERMVGSSLAINDVTYGCILDACAKAGQMEIALKIYDSLKHTKLNQNSIVYTTIIKGLIKVEKFDQAIEFFESIKEHRDLTGMIISYNCALDVLVRKGDIAAAMKLFEEIDRIYKADLISYSTIIKGLCTANKKVEAFEQMKKMLVSEIDVDISVINLFLDNCATPADFRLGIQGFQLSNSKNIRPNEVTFGIMVKIYGFSRELSKAFELLDLMAVYSIKPSIIIFTNLVHISFYNKAAKKAELAFTLFKKTGLKGDKLLYSKLIDGLIRFGEAGKVEKYIDLAIEDDVGLKFETIDKIREIFEDNESVKSKLKSIEQIIKLEKTKKYEPAFEKPKYTNRNENPANLKKLIHEQNRQDAMIEQMAQRNLQRENPNQPKRNGLNINQFGKDAHPQKKNLGAQEEEPKREFKKPLAMFNFREKKPQL